MMRDDHSCDKDVGGAVADERSSEEYILQEDPCEVSVRERAEWRAPAGVPDSGSRLGKIP